MQAISQCERSVGFLHAYHLQHCFSHLSCDVKPYYLSVVCLVFPDLETRRRLGSALDEIHVGNRRNEREGLCPVQIRALQWLRPAPHRRFSRRLGKAPSRTTRARSRRRSRKTRREFAALSACCETRQAQSNHLLAESKQRCYFNLNLVLLHSSIAPYTVNAPTAMHDFFEPFSLQCLWANLLLTVTRYFVEIESIFVYLFHLFTTALPLTVAIHSLDTLWMSVITLGDGATCDERHRNIGDEQGTY